jgi:hypothetical protein
MIALLEFEGSSPVVFIKDLDTVRFHCFPYLPLSHDPVLLWLFDEDVFYF